MILKVLKVVIYLRSFSSEGLTFSPIIAVAAPKREIQRRAGCGDLILLP